MNQYSAKKISEIIAKNWPVEHGVIGDHHANILIKSKIEGDEVQFNSAPGGDDIDVSAVLGVITEAIAFVVVVIEAYLLIKEKRKTGESPQAHQETLSEIRSRLEHLEGSLPNHAMEKFEAIIQDVERSF